MEIEPRPDRSEEVLDWVSPGDNLCTKSSRLKENKEKLAFQYLKGNLRPSRKWGDNSGQSQLLSNYLVLSISV